MFRKIHDERAPGTISLEQETMISGQRLFQRPTAMDNSWRKVVRKRDAAARLSMLASLSLTARVRDGGTPVAANVMYHFE